MKNLLNLSICKEDIKRLNETLSCLNMEIKMLKTIFRVQSNKDDIQRFVKESVIAKANEKDILKKSLENVLKNKRLIDKIPLEKKVLLVKEFLNLGKIY